MRGSSRKHIINLIMSIIKKEAKKICSRKHNSYMRLSIKELESFTWSSVENELQQQAPTLLSLLKAVSSSKPSRVDLRVVGMAAFVLLKGRNKDLSLLQGIVSAILYSGHCSKMVTFSVVLQAITRLNKLGLCLSHSKVTRIIRELGDNYDNDVCVWKREAQDGTVIEDIGDFNFTSKCNRVGKC